MINNLDFNVTTVRSRMVETKNGIFLMGQYYTKEALSPVSFSGCPFNSLTTGVNNIDSVASCHLDTSVRRGLRHRECKIASDPYIPNRYYFAMNNQHSGSSNNYSFLVHSTEVENDFLLHAITTMPQHLMAQEIIDISESYIYVLAKTTYYYGSYLCRINKSTNAVDSPIAFNPAARMMLSKLYSDDRYIYLAGRDSNVRWRFFRYDKATNAVTERLFNTLDADHDTSNAPVGQCVLNDVVYREGDYCYVYQMCRNETVNTSLLCLKIDTTKDVTDANSVQFLYPLEYQDEIKFNTHTGYEMHRFWVVDGYLYYAVYDEDHVTGYLNSIAVQGIHTFKLLPGGYLEYMGYDQIDVDEQIISMAFSSDKKVIIVGFWTAFKLMKYNEASHKYELVSPEHYTNVATVGFDAHDRLWVMSPDYALEMHSTNDPQSAVIRFQYPMYTYSGADMHSYIEFQALTFIGGYAKGMYRFEMTGPAHFEANGQRAIEVQYIGEMQQVPIVVTGSDQLACKVYYIKGGD